MSRRRPAVALGSVCGRRGGGFTLIEMLVTLLIVSMISTLLWQAMQQVFRVERILQSSGAEAQVKIVHREWLRSLIESTLPGPLNAPSFRGNASEVWLISAESPEIPGLGSGQLHLTMRQDPRTQIQSLVVQVAEDSSARSDAFQSRGQKITLMSWVGPAASFKYLNEKRQWLDEWRPSEAGLPNRLPRAVRIDFGSDVGGPLIAAIANTELPRLRRADWERQ
ncbi:prepilin-type N-terminal cleavage/methylation domain-containing protein [Paucibacter sp. DJ2R-2]|nr:prepilin-type N-terminal cleavage/methylation domain-containing protein [Paucibacter sp. DJ4R-1]MCV2441018.1 prepilin-type N-terminal cleavage/methylation domain-containing protein [Paucibacter sp. DJ2R-2]